MAWRQHMTCRISVSNKDQEAVWECELPVPAEVPLAGLFVHNLPGSSRSLSLNHRRVLWTYDNIHQRVWNQAAKNFFFWLSKLPWANSTHITIDTHHAGAAVVLALLNQHPPTNKQLHVRVHHAPLSWLQKRFAPHASKRVTLEQIAYPGCPWAQRSSQKKQRAA